MSAVRRWYIFLVCAVTLQSATWAAIALTRNLLAVGRETPAATIALQVAIIVIGLPLFLVHWLWAQRLARQSPPERQDGVRKLYLYGTLAGFLAPFVANTYDLIWLLLWLACGGSTEGWSVSEALVRDFTAMFILGVLWSYHWRIVGLDTAAATDSGGPATARRLYVLGFSAAGLSMTTLAVIHLLRSVMFLASPGPRIAVAEPADLSMETARLLIGLALWLIFWRWAQRLFATGGEEERASALRKLYIYLAVLVGALAAITNGAAIVAGLLRRLLDLPSRGDIRIPLPSILGMAGLWAFHALILRGDASVARDVPRQAAIRRLYLYLVAAVGLAAFLVGLAGSMSVLIRTMAGSVFGDALREQLAWFAAALIAGLPVWLVPWRAVQLSAAASTPAGAQERHSVVRKLFLYFFLFIATMAVLAGAVYIVWQLLTVALGERAAAGMAGALGQAVAYSMIGVAVWLYHGSVLRDDGRLTRHERVERIASTRVVLLDAGEGRFGRAVLDALRREMPGLPIDAIGLTTPAAQAMATPESTATTPNAVVEKLASAGLIVGPWEIATAGAVQGAVTPEIAEAVTRTPVRKLLAPVRTEGFDWAGVEHQDADTLARHTARAIQQIAEGAEVKPARALGAGAVIGIILGVLVLLVLVAIPLLSFFNVF